MSLEPHISDISCSASSFTSGFDDTRFDFSLYVDEKDWALTYYVITHNGYRMELNDMFKALKGLSRLGAQVNKKHLTNFSKWLNDFGDMFAEHNEFEDVHVTPKILSKANDADRKLLEDHEDEHDLLMLKLSKVRVHADNFADLNSFSKAAARIIKSGASFIEHALACLRREELREAALMRKYFDESIVGELDTTKIEFIKSRTGVLRGATTGMGIIMSWASSHEGDQIKDRYLRKFSHRVVYSAAAKPWYEKHRALLRDLHLFADMPARSGEACLATEWLQ